MAYFWYLFLIPSFVELKCSFWTYCKISLLSSATLRQHRHLWVYSERQSGTITIQSSSERIINVLFSSPVISWVSPCRRLSIDEPGYQQDWSTNPRPEMTVFRACLSAYFPSPLHKVTLRKALSGSQENDIPEIWWTVAPTSQTAKSRWQLIPRQGTDE